MLIELHVFDHLSLHTYTDASRLIYIVKKTFKKLKSFNL